MLIFPKIIQLHLLFKNWYTHLQVKHKLALGYILALGTACFGVGTGLVIGNSYQQRAELAREDVLEEIRLFNRLEANLINSLLHQEKLIKLLDYPELVTQGQSLYRRYTNELERSWSDLKISYLQQEEKETDEELAEFNEVVETYESAIINYLQRRELFLDIITKANLTELSGEEYRKIANFWNNSQTNALSLKLSILSREIEKLTDLVAQEEEDAKKFLETASRVRLYIVFSSMVLSIAIATLLAYLTNSALVNPIQELTKVAQKTIEESNFDLQVVIISDDEIGVLAQSFNQLNQKVN